MRFLAIVMSFLFLLDYHVVESRNLSDSDNRGGRYPLHLSSLAIFGILGAVFVSILLLLAFLKFWWMNSVEHLLRGISEQSANGPRGRPALSTSRRFLGLDKGSIDSLPLFSFSSIKGSREGLECAVCISKFEDAEFLRLLPKCGHAFHSNCIDRWLEGHSSCPLCRSKFGPTDLLRSGSVGSNHEILIEREKQAHTRLLDTTINNSRGRADDQRLPLHRFKHKIIMSDDMNTNTNRRSDRSSELLHLLSGNKSSAPESGSGIGPHNNAPALRWQLLNRSYSVPGTPSRLVRVAGGKRSLSEITNPPRIESNLKNQGEAEGFV